MIKHLHLPHLLSISAAMLFAIETTFADSTTDQDSASHSSSFARNVCYVDLATLLYRGAISLNYERIWQDVGIRVGYGAGAGLEDGTGSGFLVMANVFPAEGHNFEIGAGVSVMWVSRFGHNEPRRTRVYPAGSLCYRIQPSDGGFFFRFGWSYVFYYGTPFTVSLGIAF